MNEPYFQENGRTMLNTFLSSSIPAEDAAYAEVAGRQFNALLSAVIGNPDYECFVRDFWAFTVQYPGVKVRWAPFIQGAQGCGKGTLVDCLAASIGVKNYKTVTASGVGGNFNEWREGSQLVYLDEIANPGHNRHEIMNGLKDCITNDYIMIAQKFKDTRTVRNVTNYVLSTNHRGALVLEEGDRRYVVLISPIQCRAQVLALNATGIFTKIRALMEKHPGAFRSYFLSHQIPDNFPVHGPAPETTFRAELIEDSKNPLQLAVEALIEDDRYPLIGEDVIEFEELDTLTRFEQQKNGRLTKYLKDLGFSKSGAFDIGGRRRTLWTHDREFVEGLIPAEELIRMRLEAMPDEG
jgi:hypothetical protein